MMNTLKKGIAWRRFFASLLVVAECFSLTATGVPVYAAQEPVEQILTEPVDTVQTSEPPVDTVQTSEPPVETVQDLSQYLTPLEKAILAANSALQFADAADEAADDAEDAADEAWISDLEGARQAKVRADDAAARAIDNADQAKVQAELAGDIADRLFDEATQAWDYADAAQLTADEVRRAAEEIKAEAERLAELANSLTDAAAAQQIDSLAADDNQEIILSEENTQPAAPTENGDIAVQNALDEADKAQLEAAQANDESQRAAEEANRMDVEANNAFDNARRVDEDAYQAYQAQMFAEAQAARAAQAVNRAKAAVEDAGAAVTAAEEAAAKAAEEEAARIAAEEAERLTQTEISQNENDLPGEELILNSINPLGVNSIPNQNLLVDEDLLQDGNLLLNNNTLNVNNVLGEDGLLNIDDTGDDDDKLVDGTGDDDQTGGNDQTGSNTQIGDDTKDTADTKDADDTKSGDEILLEEGTQDPKGTDDAKGGDEGGEPKPMLGVNMLGATAPAANLLGATDSKPFAVGRSQTAAEEYSDLQEALNAVIDRNNSSSGSIVYRLYVLEKANVGSVNLNASTTNKNITILFENGVRLTGNITITVPDGKQVILNTVDGNPKGTIYGSFTVNGGTLNKASSIDIIAAPTPTTVTVTFKNEDGSTVGNPLTLDKGAAIGDRLPNAPTTSENFDFDGWYVGSEKLTKQSTFDADAEATARYTVTVSFSAEGVAAESVPQAQTITKGTAPASYPTVTKDGFRFDGWYVGEAQVSDGEGKPVGDPAYTFNAHTTLTAKFVEQTTVTVTFKAEGSEDQTVPVDVGGTIATLPDGPAREGYRFVGWFVSEDGTNPGTVQVDASYVFNTDATVAAKYVKLVTVQFVDGSGAVIADYTKTFDEGGTVTLPDGPALEGYTFDGWYVDGETAAVAADRTYSENTTLTAKYYVTVSFDPVGGTAVESKKVYKDKAIGTLPETEIADCTFDGWYYKNTDGTWGEKVEDTDTFTANTTVYAKYNVTVEFVAEGIEGTVDTKTIERGGTLTSLPEDPKREGYRFDGWFLADSEGKPGDTAVKADGAEGDTVFTVNTIVAAKWVKLVTVTFDSSYANGAYTDTPNVVSKGTTLDENTITLDVNTALGDKLPTVNWGENAADKATLVGWFYTEEGVEKELTATTPVPDDLTVTAHYNVTVNFHVTKYVEEGNTVVPVSTGASPRTLTRGASFGSNFPQDPVLTGYRFAGWYLATVDADDKVTFTETKVEPTTTFDEHTVVAAKFTKQVTIVFENRTEDNQTVRHEFVVDMGETVEMIENPLLADHRFDGWFDQDGKRITNAEGITDINGNLIGLDGNSLPEGAAPVRTIKASKDMTLKARFIPLAEVRFVVVHPTTTTDHSGTTTKQPSVNNEGVYTIDASETGTVIDPKDHGLLPTISGYYFEGWYRAVPVDSVTVGTFDYDTDYKQYNRFIFNNKCYAMDETQPVFLLDDDGNEVQTVTVNGTPYTANKTFTEETLVVAKLVKEVTITFRFGEAGSEEVEVRDKCLVGRPLSRYYTELEKPDHEPKTAYREGYRISGWYRGDDKVADDYKVQESDDNAIYYARYVKLVKATYLNKNQNDTKIMDETDILSGDDVTVTRSGEDLVSVTVTRDIDTALGEQPTVLDPIEVTGSQPLHFIGWFDSTGREYTEETLLTGDEVTLSARYGYELAFYLQKGTGTPYAYRAARRVVLPGTVIGWMPGAPFEVGYTFVNWTLGQVDPSTGAVTDTGTPVDTTQTVSGNTVIIGHYVDSSIYEITVNYTITGAATPTDTTILSIAMSDVPADGTSVTSPRVFTTVVNGEEKNYYPLMSEIVIKQSGDGLDIENPKTGVVVVKDDSSAPRKITVTMPYIEANATYTVKYMLKALDGNSYDLIEAVEERGATGTTVTPEVKEYAYAIFEGVDTKEIEHVSGDVLEVRYTRKNFTLTYDTMGGDALSSESKAYGTVITLPTQANNEKLKWDGHTFVGWYKDEALTDPAGDTYTLTEDTTLYAKWNSGNVNYTIVYMFEKYNDAGTAASFQYDSSETGSAALGATVYATDSGIPTLNRTGWEKNDEKNSTSSVVVKGDGSSVLYVYYKLKEYTLKFEPGTFYYGQNYDVTASLNGERKTGDNDYSYTMNVKLGQDIANTWPTRVTNARFRFGNQNVTVTFSGWVHPTSGIIYVTKRLLVTSDMLPDTGTTITYSGNWLMDTEQYTVNYWLQNADNDGYTKSEKYSQTFDTQKGGANLGAKEIAGYTYDSSQDNHKYKTGQYISGYDWWGNPIYQNYQYEYEYNFYYKRDSYTIDYFYGSNKLETFENVRFDANLNKSPYKWYPTQAQCGVDEDYIWDGWYTDAGFTTPYTFSNASTMPAHPLALYAKWVKPTYTVKFDLNYTGKPAGDYYTSTREKGTPLTHELPEADLAKLLTPTPKPDHMVFAGWFTDPTAGESRDVKGYVIDHHETLYAHWTPEIISYKVYYQDANGNNIRTPKTVMSDEFYEGQEITEYAPTIPGHKIGDEETTMIADVGSKTIELTYGTNEIVFVYSQKPPFLYYTVKYVLLNDPTVEVAFQDSNYTDTATGKEYIQVSGDYTSVTETAKVPTVEGYEDFRPTEATKSLRLGTDTSKNEIIFYYTNGAKFTVEWLDMEGATIPGKPAQETYHQEGETYHAETAVTGWVFDHAVVTLNGAEQAAGNLSFTVADKTDVYNIKLYYKKNLTILAHSAIKAYDGKPLTLDSIPENVTAEGLLSKHELSVFTLTGSQTNVGVSECKVDTNKPIRITVKATGEQKAASDFYVITPLAGSLNVTRVNVIISLEPDRWTGNTYNGTPFATGFTNYTRNSIADYISINNTQYDKAFLELLWDDLMDELVDYSNKTYTGDQAYKKYVVRTDRQIPIFTYETDPTTGNYKLVNGERVKTGEKSYKKDGLQILNYKDTGDYYEPSNVFLAALTKAIADLKAENREHVADLVAQYGSLEAALTHFTEQYGSLEAAQAAGETITDMSNFSEILYVRESRLEIDPAPLKIETQEATREYNGEALTNPVITVSVSDGETYTTITPTGENSDQYKIAEGDTVTIKAVGSQLPPGKSQNIYEIKWGDVDPENFTNAEELGNLVVTKHMLIITAEDKVKTYGTDDPAYTVKVDYQPMKQSVDGEGKLLFDTNGDPVMEVDTSKAKIENIHATLTHWTGDNYTLKLDDNRDGIAFSDNLLLTISREPDPDRPGSDNGRFDAPGVYKIIPAADRTAVYNYNIDFEPGTLTSAIARVSSDGGSNWNYFAYLEQDGVNPPHTDVTLTSAFNYVNALPSGIGDVCIETLCDDDVMSYLAQTRGGVNPGYTLNVTDYTFNNAYLGNVILRTTDAANLVHTSDYSQTRSTIKRGTATGHLLVSSVPSFTVENIVIDGMTRAGSALIQAASGSVTLGANAALQNNNNLAGNGGNGGAVYVANGAALNIPKFLNASGDDISAVIANCSAVNGGAAYVAAGAKLNVTGGTIAGNTSTGSGAGIYLVEGAEMHISGSPVFSAVTNTGIARNISTGDTDLLPAGAMNGSDQLTQAIQDIYIAGYFNSVEDNTDAASLWVDGNIGSGEGSIWVWAEESPRYLADKQFAKITSGASVSTDSLKAFRNARDNATTRNESSDYLYGFMKSGDTANVYWYYLEGERKVILRKVLSDGFTPVSDPALKFTILKGSSTEAFKVTLPDNSTQTLENLPLMASGVFWIGVLPYGNDYTIVETRNGTTVATFKLSVGDDTTQTLSGNDSEVAPGSRDGVTVSEKPSGG